MERSITILTGVAWLLQLLDGISAVQMMRADGPASEPNPLVRTVYLQAGALGVAALKAAIAGPLMVLFARLARRGRRRLARGGLIVAAVIGLLGCVSNLGPPV